MEQNKLLKLIYNFYPSNIDCVSQKELYMKSPQYKRLAKLILQNKVSYPMKVRNFISNFKELDGFVYNDATNFDWLDRCYTFEFSKKIDDGYLLLRFHKSIIAPYYLILCFKIIENNNRQKYIPVSKNEFFNQNILNKLDVIAEEFHLNNFDETILKKTISNISFEDIPFGDFNFFNAFFLNQEI